MYACLRPAYNEEELGWDLDTFLSEDFYIRNISNLHIFAISPGFPLITTWRMNARVAIGVGLYVAKFTSGSKTIAMRQFLNIYICQSSIFRECLVIQDIYSFPSASKIGQLFDFQVINITDNQEVVSIFTIGSPKKYLQKLALDVFRSCNLLNNNLSFLLGS